ncbi:VOC family protein [Alphaproteobacteria bacterium]|nr:VOC family protein [Alphaproteobacteria bacterium]
MLSIDHFVLTVTNIEKTADFYTEILGMTLQEFLPPGSTQPRFSLRFGTQKINLHSASNPFKPHAKSPFSGSADICFISDMSIETWIEDLSQKNILIEEGPVHRTGANGPIISIYVRDPDGNLIEIANQN